MHTLRAKEDCKDGLYDIISQCILSQGELTHPTPLPPHSVGTILSAAVTKTLLVQSTAAETDFAFVVRQVPARYHCTDSGAMYVCVIVADEDVTVATLQTSANVQGTL